MNKLLAYILWLVLILMPIFFISLGLYSIIIIFILFIIRFIFIGRINSLFLYPRFTHNIGQLPSVLMLLQLNIINNYKDDHFTHRFKKIIYKVSNKSKKFFKDTRIKEFKTTTNSEMIKKLKKYEKCGFIKLIEIKNSRKGLLKKLKNKIFKDDGAQPVEKLLLFGIVTTLINCRNKNYWDLINRPEKVKKYKIMITKNQNNS